MRKCRRLPIACFMLGLAGVLTTSVVRTEAAEWLAPAPQEQLSADWVKDVAKAFRTNRFKNVFMNQPFGCDQCRILEYLNDASDALDSQEPKLAKSFIRRALNVLNDGVEEGWYDQADVRPIKRLIIRKAKQGFEEADASKLALSVPDRKRRDARYEEGEEPLFSRSEESDAYGSRRDRWTGYTSERRLGLTTEPPDRDGDIRRSGSSRDGNAFKGQEFEQRQGRSQSKETRRHREKDRYSKDPADTVEEMGKESQRSAQQQDQQDFPRKSRREFREENQRDYDEATADDRFATAQDLKESANEEYDASPMRGAQGGKLRHRGD